MSLAVPATFGPSDAAEGTLLPECRIVGTGERARPWDPDVRWAEFDVFSSHGAEGAAIVVAKPSMAHVAWSAFPTMPMAGGRARVMLGGQKHVRFEGWAGLEGRTFSIKRRLFAEHGHLWARAGAPIEMLAALGGIATARVGTPFVAPKTFVVSGRCDEVVYEPDEPHHAAPKARETKESVLNRSLTIDLYAEPSGAPFTSITFASARTFDLGVVERRGAFVRVVGSAGDVGFDAWVPVAETARDWEMGTIHGSGWGSSSCGGYWAAHRGIVKVDSPLYAGKAPTALVGAVVEKDAEVRYYPEDATTRGTTELVPFEFEDQMLRAPRGGRLWIAKSAIQ